MSFQHLVSGECGGNSSLVQLSNILARDGTINGELSNNHINKDSQFNPTPQTFQMNSLLQSLNEVNSERNINNNETNKWIQEYNNFPKQINLNNIPINVTFSNFQRFPMMSPHYLGTSSNVIQKPYIPLEFLDESEVPTQFLENNTNFEEIREKAKELTNSVEDQNLAYSEFVSFMKKIGDGETSLTMSNNIDTVIEDSNIEKIKETDEWLKLKQELEHPWLSAHNLNINPYPTYHFTQNNSMLDNPNALAIGKQKLKIGDVPGAVLCFEASVKQNPSLIEGWLLLGTTQAENEQDPQAIAALSQCVELDPTCLSAYMSLGSSYTNENYPYFAYKAFIDWLKANKKYSDLVPIDVDISVMSNSQLQEHIQSLFLRAAQMEPIHVDPDIQCALGVLFNISREYSKAVDCFKAALMVRSDDSRLWNKLGATLANGERSEEAVAAYDQALALEPGFIRARYNVGITCMNLGAYKEAAEHFIIALNQQTKAQGVMPTISREDTSSGIIWSTLRMVCAFMGKHELLSLIDNRNLNELNSYFDMT